MPLLFALGVVSLNGTIRCMDTCVLLRWCAYVTLSLCPWTNEAVCSLGLCSSKLPKVGQRGLWFYTYFYIYIKDLGLKDFYCSDVCHMKLMLQINHPVGDLGTHITQTFIWAKGRDVADSGVKFKLYPKGAIASGKQHGCSFERV